MDGLRFTKPLLYQLSYVRAQRKAPQIKTADDGIRTRDLRFTKPLLYQLSYVGATETPGTYCGR